MRWLRLGSATTTCLKKTSRRKPRRERQRTRDLQVHANDEKKFASASVQSGRLRGPSPVCRGRRPLACSNPVSARHPIPQRPGCKSHIRWLGRQCRRDVLILLRLLEQELRRGDRYTARPREQL